MSDDAAHDGYRVEPGGGPRVRTDVLDVYIFRRPDSEHAGVGVGAGGSEVEFLLLERATPPLARSWQPVMGHIEMGESATEAALREVREEVGLTPGAGEFLGFWALEQTHPYFVAAIDCIVLGPRFAAEVAPNWTPALNAEHSHARWVTLPGDPDTANPADLRRALDQFHWPGQKSAVLEILRDIVRADSPARAALTIRLDPLRRRGSPMDG